jgi:hypothetical protein
VVTLRLVMNTLSSSLVVTLRLVMNTCLLLWW